MAVIGVALIGVPIGIISSGFVEEEENRDDEKLKLLKEIENELIRRKEMEKIHTEQAPAAIGPYSQAVVTGSLAYTSGQIAINPATGNLVEGGIKEQTEQVCRNLAEVLKASGSSLEKTVKTTCFLADISDFAAFNEIYGKYFSQKPARSCFAVAALPKAALVEVEVVAEK